MSTDNINLLETHSDWYQKTVSQVNSYRDSLTDKEYKKYKLDLLLRIIRRVDNYYLTCGQCNALQSQITTLVQELGNLIQTPGKEKQKTYRREINNIVKHLQKAHKLVNEGYYTGIGFLLGAGIGAALGGIPENRGIGPGLGFALGLGIGKFLDYRAKKEDRVI